VIARLAGTLLVAATLLVACAGPASSPPGSAPEATDADGPFALTLAVSAGRYREREAITAWARLTYQGDRRAVQVAGSGSGIVTFLARQLDGPLAMGGGGTDDCQRYRIEVGVPQDKPFAKGVGFSADDPNADFYRAWVEDPVLWLPRGRWELSARAEFYEEDCGAVLRQMAASVTIEVE
jgi:hypothetical protein